MTNKNKNKLVELVQDALFQHAHYVAKERRRALEAETEAEHSEIYESIKTLHEYVADHLIENVVVVPPCKVGDRVYQTDGAIIYELEVLDVSIHKNMPYYETESVDFDTRAIGKSIFLTKEQAEQKLNEMRGSNG